jgi:hypothetical protein
MITVQDPAGTSPAQQCQRCKYHHTHGTALCLVCTQGITATLITDQNVAARFRAMRQAQKAKRGAMSQFERLIEVE